MAAAIPIALGLIALAATAARSPRPTSTEPPSDATSDGATSSTTTDTSSTSSSSTSSSSTSSSSTSSSSTSSGGPRQVRPRPFVGGDPASVITKPRGLEAPLLRDVRVWRDSFGRGVLTTVDVRAWNARADAASKAASKLEGGPFGWYTRPGELPEWGTPALYRPLPSLNNDGTPDYGHPPPSSADAHNRSGWTPRSEYLAIAQLMRKDDTAARGGKLPPEVVSKLIATSHVAQLVQTLRIRAADPERRADQLEYRKAIAKLEGQLLTVPDVLRMPGVVMVVDMGHRPAGMNPKVDDPFWRVQAGILALYDGTRRADGNLWWGGKADPLAARAVTLPSQQPRTPDDPDGRVCRENPTWCYRYGGAQSSSWWSVLLSDGTVIPYVVHADAADVMDDVHQVVGFYGIGRLALFAEVLPWLLTIVQVVLQAVGAGGAVSGIGATVIKAIGPVVQGLDRYVQQAADAATLSVTRASSES